MKNSMKLGFGAALSLGISMGAFGCKSPEEAGKDMAEEKIGFAQGAAEVLEAKGGNLGQTVGKGATDLLKGLGSGVKDSAHPPVEVKSTDALQAAGITVNNAQQDGDGIDVRVVNALTTFAKPYSGRLRMVALDQGGKELCSAVSGFQSRAAGAQVNVSFTFDASCRLSKVAHCTMTPLVATTVKLAENLAEAGVKLGKTTESDEQGLTIIQYVIFEKAFKQGLQLRAYDAQGAELSRSEKTDALRLEADSAQSIHFKFSSLDPLSVAHYELYSVDITAKK